MTTAHTVCGYAAICGFIRCFLLAFVTIPVTCATDGCTDWADSCFLLVAEFYYTYVLMKFSSSPSAKVRQDLCLCFFWSIFLLVLRVWSTLMILGIVHRPAIYHTRGTAAMIANIFSGVILGTVFNALASYGSGVLLFCPKDRTSSPPEGLLTDAPNAAGDC